MNSNTRQAQTRGGSQRDLKEYLIILTRGKWWVLGIFLLVFGLAAVYVATADKVYRATSSVKIDVRALQNSLFREPTMTVATVNVIQNELQILKSTALAEAAAKKLLERRYIDTTSQELLSIVRAPSAPGRTEPGVASLQEVARRVSGVVEFEPIRESDVIKISAQSKNPREAALIANLYAEAYFDRNVYASRTKSRSFREFLGEQVKEKQESLGKSEESLRKYMEAKGVVSLDDNQKKVIDQLSQLEAQRDAVEITIQSLRRTITSYQDQIKQQEEGVAKVIGEANDPYIAQMQNQLAQLEVQRDIVAAQNPDFVGKEAYNSKLQEIDAQIDQMKKKLRQRTDDFLVNLLPGVSSGDQRDPAGYLKQIKQKLLESQVELQSQEARKKALNASIGEYNQQFENLPRKNMDFARLQREKQSLEKLYLTIEEKYNEANITEQAELGYIEIFDRAMPPGGPSSPKVALTLLMGCVAGLGFGFMFVIGKEYMREMIRTPEDLKKKGFSLLATVMDMTDEIKKLPARTDGKAARTNGKTEPQSGVHPTVVMLSNPLSPVAESYRHLRTTVQLAQRDAAAPRTFMVTSPDPGEGKTTTVANLAVAFARSGKRTVLVDADLRKPSVHTTFGLRMKPGFSELLCGDALLDQVVQQTEIHDLDVIASGAIPANPAEFLGSDAMKRVLETLKARYDVLLFDCPPVLAVTDATVLSMTIDRLILVVSSGKTKMQALETTRDMLEDVGVKPAGIVLNNFNVKQAYGSRYHTSGYGYYGHAYGTRANGNGGAKSRSRVS